MVKSSHYSSNRKRAAFRKIKRSQLRARKSVRYNPFVVRPHAIS